MRLGIDASRLRAGMSGIGRYIQSLLEPLDAALPEAQFILYTRADYVGSLPSERWRIRVDRAAVSRRLPLAAWTRYRLGALARQDRLDVLWAANTLTPSRPLGMPCVTTVYDLNHLLYPQTMPVLTRLAHRHWFRSDVLNATRVVAISEGTSSRLHAQLGRAADAIARPAVPMLGLAPEHDRVLKRLGLLGVRPPYLLTVGTREPRKNIESAIAAVAMMKSRGGLAGHQLVMVGAEGWGRVADNAQARAAKEWIQPVGYVDDATLAMLYSLADAFIFPSLYEGYGIPVGEALSFGCRVVATDLPELHEVGAADVTYVAPTPEAIAEGLDVALGRPAPTARLPLHSWADAAATMADMFRQAARQSD